MGGMKTFMGLFGLSCILATPLAALTDVPRERTKVFAVCLGRASAEMEHRWLVGGGAEVEQDRRAMFEILLDTVAPRSGLPGPQILDMRIRAKMAQAHLLQIATFHTDPERKRRAAAAARQAMRPCSALLLG
ncbi:hypothetical protein [uncultured Mameliella sp.]|uniref:hypothetical protein n=2 Tax=Mameliella TaxID=1434019 RepID=UPI002610A839|nr:hypothetical protein [uncultured Mameliella sp.]